MGLCYERLGQTKKTIGAFRQAWNTLLELRDRDLQHDAESRGKGVEFKEISRRDDDIGIILGQARAVLEIKNPNDLENEEEGASDGGGEPAVAGGSPSKTSERRSTSAEGDYRRLSLIDR